MTRSALILTTVIIMPLIASCGVDPVEQAYGDCMAQVGEAKVDASNEAMKGMVEGVQEMAESGCGMILTTCESDRDGPMCQAMIRNFNDSK